MWLDILKTLFAYIHKNDPDETNRPSAIDHSTYIKELSTNHYNPFDNSVRSMRARRAFEMVLDTRKFEIDLYWKRAGYFWAFIGSVFAAYLALQEHGSDLSKVSIIALGIVISAAWHFSNLGSKQWQRHWEKHLDLLEDPFVGPLYKTVYYTKTYSVSKLNNIVSVTVIIVWIVLLKDQLDLMNIPYFGPDYKVEFEICIIFLLTILAIYSMHFGYGRGRFGTQNADMHRRKVKYQNDDISF